MAKYYFRLLLLVAAIVGIFALIGSLLPRGYTVSSQVDISAPIETVFEHVNRLDNWPAWSPWNPDKVASLQIEFIGDEGVGNAMSWNDGRGQGKLWITASEPCCQVDYKMRFGKFPEMNSTILLSDSGKQTTVKWQSAGVLPGGPFYGYLAPLFGTHMQYEYDESLQRLKTIAESNSMIESQTESNSADIK